MDGWMDGWMDYWVIVWTLLSSLHFLCTSWNKSIICVFCTLVPFNDFQWCVCLWELSFCYFLTYIWWTLDNSLDPIRHITILLCRIARPQLVVHAVYHLKRCSRCGQLDVKYSGKVDISVDKIFLFKLFFLGFFSVCLLNIHFNIFQ